MATDAAAAGNRPRPWLLMTLAVVVVVFLMMKFWPSGRAPAPLPTREAARARADGQVDPEDLKVRLEALEQKHPGPGDTERNPFRFQPRAEPPPPGGYKPPPGPTGPPQPPPGPPPPPPPPPGPPPIPLKFIGIVQADATGKVAAFSDCRATFQGREGAIIDGRYRLVKIGVQSVEMEYLDGRGRTTIRMSGQECVGR
jgi:hypothetical protein